MHKNKALQDLLKEVDPTKSFWLVADTGSLNPPAPAKGKDAKEGEATPRMESISMTVDLSSGLGLDALAHLASEADARVAYQGLQTDLQAAADNFLVKMLGAAPLLGNMKLAQDKLTSRSRHR